MPLICLRDVCLHLGQPLLLDTVNLTIEPNERIGLIGRNGVGKSSLLKVLQGIIKPDSGSIEYATHCTIASLVQEVPQDLEGSVYDIVASGLGEIGAIVMRYQTLIVQADAIHEQELSRLQSRIEQEHAWDILNQVDIVLSKLSLNGEWNFAECSGGLKRRVLLARAMVQNPSILLLDEPTNHLDIESIQWLETALLQYPGTLVFITHDRAFLQNLATRIIEIDRGKLTSWPGNYQLYCERKQAALEAEEKSWSEFDKKLAQEEVWIRQGIKARRTRNEGRVRALEKMRRERAQRQTRQGMAELKIHAGKLSGKQVLVAQDVSFSFGEKKIVEHFSLILSRGDKVGIVGPNGCGKSTLIRLLLGEYAPTEGRIQHGTNLQVIYFDQTRAQLKEEKTAIENLDIGSDSVTINGKTQHVISYLQDFLFTPARARTLVKHLSGGERNRLLLAKLFLRPSNMIVMDEPTNDLDMDTLDLLEEILANYEGTLLLISHDRAFLDNVVTSTLVFEGNGVVTEYQGGYQDWQKMAQQKVLVKSEVKEKKSSQVVSSTPKRKLSYQEQRELSMIPGKIEALESEQATLEAMTLASDFYKRPSEETKPVLYKLAQISQELSELYERWEKLDS